jgi:hypothetical protein
MFRWGCLLCARFPAVEVVAGAGWLAADAGDEVGGDVAEFAVVVLRVGAQEREGGHGGALLLGHEDAEGPVDDGAGGERLFELGGVLGVGGAAQGEGERGGGLGGEGFGVLAGGLVEDVWLEAVEVERADGEPVDPQRNRDRGVNPVGEGVSAGVGG